MPTLPHFTHRRRLPRLWTKVVGECVSAARSTSFGLRPVSTRTTSAWQFVERPILAQSGRFASEPEAVALDCALRFESPPNSRPSMVSLCRALCFCRLLSSYRCCRLSRRLHRLITGRRHAGADTASCRAIISHQITAFQLTPRKLRFRAWRAATGALGISIQSQVITGTMATGTISAGLASTVVATMAAASALAGRGRRSGRSGIAAD
jgi:DNA-binding transcriptional LysR family regulator